LPKNSDQEQRVNITEGRTFDYTTDSQLSKQQFENSATNFCGLFSLLEISTALHSSDIIISYLYCRHGCKVHTNLLSYVFICFATVSHRLNIQTQENVIIKIKSSKNITFPLGVSYRRPNRGRIDTLRNMYGGDVH